MRLYDLILTFLPVPLGLTFAAFLGVCILRPGRCVLPAEWMRFYS